MIFLIIEFIFVQFLLPLKQNSDLSMCFDEEQLKMWRYELKAIKFNTKFCDASVLTETISFPAVSFVHSKVSSRPSASAWGKWNLKRN
jgi:uncharacterized membrane protein